MFNKIVLTAAIIAIAIATVVVAASEMANAENSELLMKLMAFPYLCNVRNDQTECLTRVH